MTSWMLRKHIICCTGPKIWVQKEKYIDDLSCAPSAAHVCFRTLYLFFGDAHVVCDVWEDGGLDEKSLLTPCGPPTLQCGSFSLPALYQIHYLIELLLVNLQITAALVLFVCRLVNLIRQSNHSVKQNSLTVSCTCGPWSTPCSNGFPRTLDLAFSTLRRTNSS